MHIRGIFLFFIIINMRTKPLSSRNIWETLNLTIFFVTWLKFLINEYNKVNPEKKLSAKNIEYVCGKGSVRRGRVL